MPINLSSFQPPSAASIASAVAAPSAATIASAVAAPSAATITSIVQNNANPSAWTMIANQDFSGTTSVTISGLSSYKKIKVALIYKVSNANNQVQLRFNGDSGGQYYRHNATSFATAMDVSWGSNTEQRMAYFEVEDVSIASPSKITFYEFDSLSTIKFGLYNNPNAISYLTLITAAGNFATNSKITVWGQ